MVVLVDRIIVTVKLNSQICIGFIFICVIAQFIIAVSVVELRQN
jgi:hypothetical protein